MVTVIIPTYKRSEYIERAIQSILMQTYKDIEIIVVDDNDSNTEERKMLEKKMEKYSNNKKIIYIQHKNNKNGAAARNTGIKIAHGEYITFLDDDDYFLPNRIETMVNTLNANNDFDCAYSSTIITKSKKIIGYNRAEKSGNMKKQLLTGDFSFGSGSNLFFRAKAIKEINGFDESFKRHQDIETMLRYFNIGKIIAVKEYLLVKTQDDRSNEPDVEKYENIKKHYFQSFKNDINQLDKTEYNKFFKKNYMELVYTCIKEKKYELCKKYENMAEKYGKIGPKNKLRILMLYINNYVKIEEIKYFIKSISIDKSIKKQIKYYENL